MSQPGSQTIAIYIFTNISRSKGNQAMKFGQLIEYNMGKKQKNQTKKKKKMRSRTSLPDSFSA